MYRYVWEVYSQHLHTSAGGVVAYVCLYVLQCPSSFYNTAHMYMYAF